MYVYVQTLKLGSISVQTTHRDDMWTFQEVQMYHVYLTLVYVGIHTSISVQTIHHDDRYTFIYVCIHTNIDERYTDTGIPIYIYMHQSDAWRIVMIDRHSKKYRYTLYVCRLFMYIYIQTLMEIYRHRYIICVHTNDAQLFLRSAIFFGVVTVDCLSLF